jgi:hypothetical protein
MADDPYIGRVKVDKSTGERFMWMGASKGFVPVDSNNVAMTQKRYAPEIEKALTKTQDTYDKAREVLPYALEFQRLNRERGTGGLFDRQLPFVGAPSAYFSPQTQRMDSLSNKMVRSQIQPGTSGAANTVVEQEMLKSTFPSISNRGDVNDQNVRAMKIDRDIQLERMQFLQKWANAGGRNIAEFEAQWAPYEADRRAALARYYVENAREPTALPSGVSVRRIK